MITPKLPIYRRARAWTAAILAIFSLVVANGSAIAQSQPAYTQPDLDRMLAPIALYPDPLLSQILMASTYPIEVIEAARWSRANPGLRGDAAVRAAGDKDWDPSVTSLVAFPEVLARMDENLEWTRRLGDAFLVQEPQVMETVQQLRLRAQAAGTLATDERTRVVNEGRMIVVQPVDPRVIYVPYYDPRLAYGTWWWPAYPPVVWAPWPGYTVRYAPSRPGIAVGLFWGPAVRISIGFFFGAIDWPRREVRVVSVNNYYYRPAIVRRETREHVTRITVAPGPWRHDPWHRRGVTYRTPEMRQRYAPAAPIREAPHAEQRRPDVARPRPDSATPPARQAQGAQGDRAAPRVIERKEVRPNGPPQDRRADSRYQNRKPADVPARTMAPTTVSRPEATAAPVARDVPRSETARAQRRPSTASPRPGVTSPTDNPAPVVLETRRGDARARADRQGRRTDNLAPSAREQTRREAGTARAERGPRRQADDESNRPRPPRKDNRN